MIDYFTNSKAPTLATTYDATITVSTAITLNAGTTYIEVSPILRGVFLKWDGTASSSSFDEFIQAETTRLYVVPEGTTTVEFIEETSGATPSRLVVIEK